MNVYFVHIGVGFNVAYPSVVGMRRPEKRDK